MPALARAGTAVVFALWVAVCAAAPEYIWQGLRIAVGHPDVDEMLGSLLVGLVLAFFIEPLIDRARSFANPKGQRERFQPKGVMFTAFLSLAFAFTSVCLHDALTAFVTGRIPGQAAGSHSAVSAGLAITLGWAIVPFAVTVAWQSAGYRWLTLPLAIVAALSPYIAGRTFSWDPMEIVTTAIPCIAILAFGYVAIARRGFHARTLARVVGLVAVAWLLLAAVVNVVLVIAHTDFRLYAASDYWTDARFYIGWLLGLLLAPQPNGLRIARHRRHSAEAMRPRS